MGGSVKERNTQSRPKKKETKWKQFIFWNNGDNNNSVKEVTVTVKRQYIYCIIKYLNKKNYHGDYKIWDRSIYISVS